MIGDQDADDSVGDAEGRPDRAAEGHGPEGLTDGKLTRRIFLGGVAGASAWMYFRPNRLLKAAFPDEEQPNAVVGRGTTPVTPITVARNPNEPDITISVERGTDLVLLDFAFYSCEVQVGSAPAIVPTAAGAAIVVQFPPQAIAEGAYPWSASSVALEVDPPPILSALSGPSRLVFSLPLGQSIPLPTMTVADLLDWSGWKLLVPAVAQVSGPSRVIISPAGEEARAPAAASGPPVPTEPTELETAIEFPYALFLAPTVYASGLVLDGFTTGFSTRAAPLVSSAGVVDLWSASLVGGRVVSLAGEAPYVPAVSAVWADDYASSPLVGPPANATPETNILYLPPPPK
jgi:hypothetical protein